MTNGRLAPVTVVVPAFNNAATIDAALASLAAQDLPVAEVVVVDDASVDSTSERAERWTDLLPLTVLRLSRNIGPAEAMNRVLSESDRQFGASVAADDILLPDHFRLLMEASTAATIVSPNIIQWWPGLKLSAPSWHDYGLVPASSAQRLEILRSNFVAAMAMFPIAKYREVGGFRSDMSGAEDWDLWIRMIRSGATVTSIPGPTYIYRRSAHSLSSTSVRFVKSVRLFEEMLSLDLEDDERLVASKTLRRLRAESRLDQAYRFARRGEIRRARTQAATAVVSERSVSRQAIIMLAMPKRRIADLDRQGGG
jgi:glycosyltransferase involved in cell wall biosynthesis